MITHPNALLLQNAYQAVALGDLHPMLSILSDEMTWTDSTLGPLAGSYRKDEVPQFFGKMMDVYHGTLRVEVAAMIAGEGDGIVLTRESGTVDGEKVAWTGVHVYTFDSGRVTRFVNYGSAEYQRFWADKRAYANR
jgi:ketosteroid isomerase-like protein